MSDVGQVSLMIGRLPKASNLRVHVIAQILRELLEKSGQEAELAFTLVMAELAERE